MAKVRIEAFCWGAGTALGELPPYFMARAHRLSGYDSDEEEDEFDELQEIKNQNQEEMVIFNKSNTILKYIPHKADVPPIYILTKQSHSLVD